MIISIPCLYTKQKTKKRKSWNDGTLKIDRTSGSCRLFDNLDGRKLSVSMLEVKTLRGDELAIALRGEECEIEFETYLVTVDAVEIRGGGPSLKSQKVGSSSSRVAAQVKPAQVKSLQLAPFKPPSKVAPDSNRQPESEDHYQGNDETKIGSSNDNTHCSSSNSTAIVKFKGMAQRPADFSKRYEGTSSVVVTRAGLDGARESRGGTSSSSFGLGGGGKYQVDDDELDELWEGEEEEEDEHGEVAVVAEATAPPAVATAGGGVGEDLERGENESRNEQQPLTGTTTTTQSPDVDWDHESPLKNKQMPEASKAVQNRWSFGNVNGDDLWGGGGAGDGGERESAGEAENLNPTTENAAQPVEDMWSF